MKKKRTNLLILFDIAAINLSYALAFYLKFDVQTAEIYIRNMSKHIVIITIIKILIFYLFKLYKSLWEYASIDEMLEVVGGSIVANIVAIFYMHFMQVSVPKSIYYMVLFIDIFFIGGTRFLYRAVRRLRCDFTIKDEHYKKVLIVGAGAAGALVIKELRNHRDLYSKPIALIDDNPQKRKQNINGVPVVGNSKDIVDVCQKYDIDEIIIAIPSASGKEIQAIVNECKKTKCKTKILPGVYELIDEQVSVKKIRDVEISDLLGRKEIKLEIENICEYIKDKNILITGGGGSIGSELCRQIARFEPNKLIILDIYENNAYDIQNELLSKYKDLSLKVIIASIRDRKRIEDIFRMENINVVFHAAAHKHVPLMEDNPTEAVKNNVFGTLNLVEISDKYGIEKFVLISTDKAVNPTNVMGATKRIAEIIIQMANKYSKTDYVAVRFGNVLGSNGSVIPLFQKQIENGGPVTVTDPRVIRYFMTIPEACQLVLEAGAMAEGGEIFILDMGEPVKIMDLAKDLINLSGLEPEVDIPIVITGLRPGEKLYEELLIDKNKVNTTKHDKIYIEKPVSYDEHKIKYQLKKLEKIINVDDDYLVKKTLEEILPSYKPYIRLDKPVDKSCTEIDNLSEIAATDMGISDLE